MLTIALLSHATHFRNALELKELKLCGKNDLSQSFANYAKYGTTAALKTGLKATFYLAV